MGYDIKEPKIAMLPLPQSIILEKIQFRFEATNINIFIYRP